MCWQALGCPLSKTAQFTEEFQRIVEGAPEDMQEAWNKQKPKAALAAATGAKRTNKRKFPTGGGTLCILKQLGSNKQQGSPLYYSLCMEVGKKYEAGELVACKARGIDLIGKQLQAVKKRAGRPPGQKLNLKAFYEIIGPLKPADQIELMSDMVSNIRTWEGAKTVRTSTLTHTCFLKHSLSSRTVSQLI